MTTYRGFACLRCGGEAIRPTQALYNICKACTYEHTKEQVSASSKVNKAVREGALQHVREKNCLDCGAPAVCYDHRDYTRPMDVQPVCKSCNKKRGYAMDSKLRVQPVKHFSKNDAAKESRK